MVRPSLPPISIGEVITQASWSKSYTVALRDLQKISPEIQYVSDASLVHFLCLVVQRSVYLVGLVRLESELGGKGQVCSNFVWRLFRLENC
jgi:hypothetical protein